ncbi:MAG: hypothetical protein P4L90_06365 [Rhodopila sp.]|nr:hypothetical protein [Rhodopila sp.]
MSDPQTTITTAEEATTLLRAAHAKATAGNAKAALDAVQEIVPLFPNNVNVLHVAGMCLRDAGRSGDAQAMFERVFAITPRFHYTELEVADLYALRGDVEAARTWFARAIETEPSHAPSYMRAAAFERGLGNHRSALLLLQRAHELQPEDPDVARRLADVMLYHARREDALLVLEAIVRSDRASDDTIVHYLRLCSEMGHYDRVLAWNDATAATPPGKALHFHRSLMAGHAKLATRFVKDDILREATARERSPRWFDGPAIETALRVVIANRQPFSLVRLGDGEGRFLCATDPWLSEIVTAEEAATIGGSIWSNWFGHELTTISPPMIGRLRNQLEVSLENADVIGLPLAERLNIDGYHFGYLAYLERHVSAVLVRRPAIAATDAFVNLILHRLSPFYRQVLAGLDFLGVISPHPELATRLGGLFNIGELVSYVVPGEMRLPDHVRRQSGDGHFPGRFDALMTNISVPRSGAVFLVAAGLLGKIYCARIKQLGGIAIDVGSVVDAWMGYNTRPGQFDKRDDWTIPPTPR